MIYTIAAVLAFFFSSAFMDAPPIREWIDEAARLSAVSGVTVAAFRTAVRIPQVEYFRREFGLWNWRYRISGVLALLSLPIISLYLTVGRSPHIYLPGERLPAPLDWVVKVVASVLILVMCIALIQVIWEALRDFLKLVWRFMKHPGIAISRKKATTSANILFTGLYMAALFFGLGFLCALLIAPLMWLGELEGHWVSTSGTVLADLSGRASIALAYLAMLTPMVLAAVSVLVRSIERRRRRRLAQVAGVRREPASAWMIGAVRARWSTSRGEQGY